MGRRKYHEHVESFLTSSAGLAAFESLLKFLSHESSAYLLHEKRVVSRIFTTGDIYFEVDHAIQTFAAAEGLHYAHSIRPIPTVLFGALRESYRM